MKIKLYKTEDELLADYPKLQNLKDFAYRIGASISMVRHQGMKDGWVQAILSWQRQWGLTEVKVPNVGDWCIDYVCLYQCVEEKKGKVLLDVLGRGTKLNTDCYHTTFLNPPNFIKKGTYYSVGDVLWSISSKKKCTVACIVAISDEVEHYFLDRDTYSGRRCERELYIAPLRGEFQPYTGQDVYPVEFVDEVVKGNEVYKVEVSCEAKVRQVKVRTKDYRWCKLSQSYCVKDAAWKKTELSVDVPVKADNLQKVIEILSWLKGLIDRGLDEYFQDVIDKVLQKRK